MEQPQPIHFLHGRKESPNYRRALLPAWIRFFTWFFMISAVASTLSAVFILIANQFGISTFVSVKVVSSFVETITGILFLTKTLTAYGLWFQKNWAVDLGISDAVVHIAFCVFMLFSQQLTGFSNQLRLELLILIPYLVKLIQIKPRWDKLSQH